LSGKELLGYHTDAGYICAACFKERLKAKKEEDLKEPKPPAVNAMPDKYVFCCVCDRMIEL